MPNEQLDYQLAHLEAEIVLLGGLVEAAIFKSVRALRNRDLDVSREIIKEDDRIDDLETKIQNECVEQIPSASAPRCRPATDRRHDVHR